MATVISLRHWLEQRRREQFVGIHRQCIEILERNRDRAERLCATTTGFEQEVWRQRLRTLAALVDYAKRYA